MARAPFLGQSGGIKWGEKRAKFTYPMLFYANFWLFFSITQPKQLSIALLHTDLLRLWMLNGVWGFYVHFMPVVLSERQCLLVSIWFPKLEGGSLSNLFSVKVELLGHLPTYVRSFWAVDWIENVRKLPSFSSLCLFCGWCRSSCSSFRVALHMKAYYCKH